MQKFAVYIIALACLFLNGTILAEAPDFVVVYPDEGVVDIYHSGNANAPPPIVIVDGEVVNGGGNGGPPDCSKAVNRPICQTLAAALDVNCANNFPPDIIVVGTNGHGAQIFCVGNAAAPPPIVVVNGECVNCGN